MARDEAGELRDAYLRRGRHLVVPAFFGFEAKPAGVTRGAERVQRVGEGNVAFAEELGRGLAVLDGRVFQVDVFQVAAERGDGVGGGFAGAGGVLDVPERAGLGGV